MFLVACVIPLIWVSYQHNLVVVVLLRDSYLRTVNSSTSTVESEIAPGTSSISKAFFDLHLPSLFWLRTLGTGTGIMSYTGQPKDEEKSFNLPNNMSTEETGRASPVAGLKVNHDGSTILSPQPSNDPNDPLNWSVVKKHVFLFVIAVTAFLPDYGSSTGAITNLVQPE